MSDLITLAISIIFGSLALVVILGFVLVLRNPGRPRYERENYFSRKRERKASSSGNQEPSYSSRFDEQRSSYRSGNISAQNQEGRKILAIVVLVAVIGITISIIYESFVGLLLIFALPIIVNYLRSRSSQNRGRRSEKDDSSSFSN